MLEVQAAVDDAAARLPAVTAGLERQPFALAAAQARRAEAQERADAALDKLHDRMPGSPPSPNGWAT